MSERCSVCNFIFHNNSRKIACAICQSMIHLKCTRFNIQGPVVQKPINANLGLNLLNLRLNFNPRLLCVVQS